MHSKIITPAIVFDNQTISVIQSQLAKLHRIQNLTLLFPMKVNSLTPIIELLTGMDGFSASSYFEIKIISETKDNQATIHFTSPAIRDSEVLSIFEKIDYISFNSLSQLERYGENAHASNVSVGLRINPQVSFVDDKRYNPSRKHSKLGVPLESIVKILSNGSSVLRDVRGIHFHTNCESSDFNELLTTVKHLDTHIPKLLHQVEWVNMGGGYLFDESDNMELLGESIDLLKRKYDVEVFIEPGKGIVGKAGKIVSSVVDIFESDGKNIAVLDTTVNHMPEVFEYQYKPVIMNETKRGKYKYILAGASCLAGDLFGEYRFKEPLEIGSRIVFENMGAYTMVKAHMFNGINLPSVYIQHQDGTLELVKEYTYEDFKSRCGADSNVSI